MKQLSVVLPCLNEEEGVTLCIDKILNVFRQYDIDGEIIVVDNGCTDNTIKLVKDYNLENIKVVEEENQGYGNAYKKGFEHVSGKVIIMGDADNTYDFYEIPNILKKLEHADFVVGNRKYLAKGSMPFMHRYIGRPIFKVLMKISNVPITDSHCGFGGIKKEALDKLNLESSGMEFASEILIKAHKAGLKIDEIPITYSVRQGESKLKTYSDGVRHLKLITKEMYKDERR